MDEILKLREERQRIRDCMSRCTDLFGSMLLMGKLKALHREEARAQAQSGIDNG